MTDEPVYFHAVRVQILMITAKNLVTIFFLLVMQGKERGVCNYNLYHIDQQHIESLSRQ